MAADALDFWEFDEYLERLEEDALVSSILEPSKRYLRDMEDPIDYYTNVQFKKRYRFEKETVLLMMKDLHITERLQRFTRQGLPLPPLIRFVCALRIYATGSFQTMLGDVRKIHQSTVSRCLHQVTRIIAEQLPDFVRFREDCRAAILRETGLPDTVGVLVNMHVPILNPGGRAYLNAGRYNSLNVQLACGAGGEICDVVARWPGGTPDAHVYAHSALGARLASGDLAGHLAGDGARRPGVLTPGDAPAGEAETRYAAAHARAMALGRTSVARLRGRTTCLGGRGLNYAPSKVGAIVCACVVLHNVAVLTGDTAPDDEGGKGKVVPRPRAERSPQDEALRRAFIERHFR